MTIPAVFFGHGSPMNALETNRYTEVWSNFGATIERPRGIVAISAHWYIGDTAVTAQAQPPTIHDFGGFPQELFDVQYRAPGSPELAAEVATLLQPLPVRLDTTTWGLDHGTWSVLAHVFPLADVPVIQLSLDGTKPFSHHVGVGRALAPLMDDGVLLMGSGNVVHNLRAISWGAEGHGAPWAERFDAATTELLRSDPSEIEQLKSHPDYQMAVPTDDHFLPLVVFAGIADAARGRVQVIGEGCTMGSLSMTSYAVA
jgi:4,5-DOPA dioxygenase extradiol